MTKIHHPIRASTRQFPTLLNITDKIAINEVDEEAGITYSCPASPPYITIITSLPADQTTFRDLTTKPSAGLRSSPFPPSEWQSDEMETHQLLNKDDVDGVDSYG
jgi:hypothetical protein